LPLCEVVHQEYHPMVVFHSMFAMYADSTLDYAFIYALVIQAYATMSTKV
jgi:hypothetical protein